MVGVVVVQMWLWLLLCLPHSLLLHSSPLSSRLLSTLCTGSSPIRICDLYSRSMSVRWRRLVPVVMSSEREARHCLSVVMSTKYEQHGYIEKDIAGIRKAC